MLRGRCLFRCNTACLGMSPDAWLLLRPRRDDARNVLVAMVAELGVGCLPYAVSTLRSALPPRGTAAHVLGYTLHALLAALMQARAKALSRLYTFLA